MDTLSTRIVTAYRNRSIEEALEPWRGSTPYFVPSSETLKAWKTVDYEFESCAEMVFKDEDERKVKDGEIGDGCVGLDSQGLDDHLKYLCSGLLRWRGVQARRKEKEREEGVDVLLVVLNVVTIAGVLLVVWFVVRFMVRWLWTVEEGPRAAESL